MMVKITVFAVCVALLSILLKQDFKVCAVMLSLAGCCTIFLMCASLASEFMKSPLFQLSPFGMSGECMTAVIKTTAVAYAASFGADICEDAGEKAIGAAVEASGKLIMLSSALPLLGGIFTAITKMLG